MAAVSIFFVIVKGIEFGDEQVQKWLSAILVSLLSSILLTQPIKVIQIHKNLLTRFKNKFLKDCIGNVNICDVV